MLTHLKEQQASSQVSSPPSRRLGVWGLYLYGFSAFFAPALANIALGPMLLAALLEPARTARAVVRNGSLALLLAMLALLGFGLAFQWPAEYRALDLTAGSHFVELWIFWLIAYWIGGDDRRIVRLLAVTFAGFMLGRIVAIDWTTPPAILTGERIRLGFSSINHFGEYAGALLIGLMCFRERIWQTPGTLRLWARIVWIASTLTAIYWSIVTQSRMVWVALVALLALHVLRGGMTKGRTRIALLAGGAVIGLGVVGLTTNNLIANRIFSEESSYRQVLDGDWASMPYDSTGTRVHMIQFGLEHWLAHPWFGNGPGATPRLLADAPAEPLRIFKHVHNLPMELLIRLGLVGATIMIALFATIVTSGLRGWQQGLLRTDVAVFVLSVLALDAMCNLTDFRLLAWDGRNFWLLFAGLSYSTTLRART